MVDTHALRACGIISRESSNLSPGTIFYNKLNYHKSTITSYGKVSYLDSGEGKDIIFFLHGWNSTPYYFYNLQSLNSKQEYRIICPWIPYSGKSFIPSKSFTFKNYIDVFEEFVKLNNFNNIHLVGHSLGGSIALALSATIPDNISSLVVLDPPLKPLKMNIFSYIRFMKRGLHDYLNDEGLKRPINMFSNNDKFHFRYEFRLKRILSGISINISILNEARIPILILWGKDDYCMPLKDYKDIIRTLKYSKLKVLPGHHIWHNVYKEDFLVELSDFIQQYKK